MPPFPRCSAGLPGSDAVDALDGADGRCHFDINPPQLGIAVESDVEPARLVGAHLLTECRALGPSLVQPGGQPAQHPVVALNDEATHWADPGVMPRCVDLVRALLRLAHMAALSVRLARPEAPAEAAAVGDAERDIVHGDVGVAGRPEEASRARSAS